MLPKALYSSQTIGASKRETPAAGGHLSTSGDEVVHGHHAADEIVPVVLDAGEGDVPGRRAHGAVQPDRHVRQLGSLIFVDGAGVSKPQWKVENASGRRVLIGVPVDGEDVPRLGAHDDAVRGGIKVLDGSRHAVDVVVLLIQVPRQHDPKPLIQRHGGGLRRAILSEAAGLVVVRLVVLIVARDLREQALVAVVEEHLRGVLVDHGRSPLGARDEGGGVARSGQNVLHVQRGGLAATRPGLVPPADVLGHEAQAFGPHGLVHAQRRQLATQHLVAAAVDAVQAHVVTEGPLRACVGRGATDAGQPPWISQQE